MICKVHIEAPMCCCCVKSRGALLGWGCVKLTVTIILLLCALTPLVELLVEMIVTMRFDMVQGIISFGVLCALSATDVVYQSMLIHGLRKNKVDLLMRYINYSKVLWVLTPILGFVYAMIEVNDLLWISPPWRRYELTQLMFIQIICIMFVSLVFQTCAMRAARSEIAKLANIGSINNENDDKPRRFNAEFILKIETSNTEKGTKNDENVEVIETTCEKAKLTE